MIALTQWDLGACLFQELEKSKHLVPKGSESVDLPGDFTLHVRRKHSGRFCCGLGFRAPNLADFAENENQ